MRELSEQGVQRAPDASIRLHSAQVLRELLWSYMSAMLIGVVDAVIDFVGNSDNERAPPDEVVVVKGGL